MLLQLMKIQEIVYKEKFCVLENYKIDLLVVSINLDPGLIDFQFQFLYYNYFRFNQKNSKTTIKA